jgi:hypothetical protein
MIAICDVSSCVNRGLHKVTCTKSSKMMCVCTSHLVVAREEVPRTRRCCIKVTLLISALVPEDYEAWRTSSNNAYDVFRTTQSEGAHDAAH